MRRLTLGLLFCIQAISAVFFVSDILLSVFGIYVPPIDWKLYEMMEVFAALSLILGMILGGRLLVTALREAHDAQSQVHRMSKEFSLLMLERFEQWGLTAAERDVALLTIKGLSVADVAAARNVSSGTIKAQSNAIFRKSGVKGRSEFFSLFLDDLMDEEIMSRLHQAGGTISRAA